MIVTRQTASVKRSCASPEGGDLSPTFKLRTTNWQSGLMIERNANLEKNDGCEKIALIEFGPAVHGYAKAIEDVCCAIKLTPAQTAGFRSAIADFNLRENSALAKLRAYFNAALSRGGDK